MEKRRQQLPEEIFQPLGRREQPKRGANGGIGEDLGTTDFKSKQLGRAPRPKIVSNPARAKRVVPPSPSAQSDTDPIDFLSSQEQPATGSGSSTSATTSTSKRTNTSTKSALVPQPPPFSKRKPDGVAPKPKVVAKSRPASSAAKRRESPHGSDGSDSSHSLPTTRSKAGIAKLSSPPAGLPVEREAPRAVAAPAPPPFAGLARTRNTNKEVPKDTSSVPKPAPPPFKGPSTLPKPKRTASSTLPDRRNADDVQPPATVNQTANLVTLKDLPRIPKKGQSLASNPTKEPTPPAPKRTPAEFPMAAYARENAAKLAAQATEPPSPRKRFRPEEIERLLQSPSKLDDSLNIGNETQLNVDPKDLCPFCDELLPDNPSPDLLRTMAELKLLAQPEPRHRNPFGLTAPLTTFINLCHMHRAESTYVQRGKENHWPVTINWNSVRERLRSARIVEALQTIIADPDSSEFFLTLSKTIARDGALKAASIKAQLDNFQLSHPGYYGEQGTLVFFDVLSEVFSDISPEECTPLQPREFFLSVLVPEAAALLVEEDMNCTHEEALVILRESRQYGQMMFPDRGDVLGLDENDRMDEAGAKQLQWRKDMIQPDAVPDLVASSGLSGELRRAKPPPFKKTFGDDVLILD